MIRTIYLVVSHNFYNIFFLYFQWIIFLFHVPCILCVILYLACRVGSAKMWNYHVQSYISLAEIDILCPFCLFMCEIC
jgi:hypothetical protein